MATFDFSLNPTDFSGPVRRAQEEQLMLRQRRNALAQQEQGMADQARFRNALTTGGVNAAAQVDPVAAQPYVQQQDAQRAKALHGVAAKAWGIYSSPAPKVAAQAQGLLESFAQESGKPLEALTDDDVRILARQDAEKAIAAGGLDPRQFQEPQRAKLNTLYQVDENGRPVYRTPEEAAGKPAWKAPEKPVSVSTGGAGKPPAGYQWTSDPQTGEAMLSPVKGGPADKPQTGPQDTEGTKRVKVLYGSLIGSERQLANLEGNGVDTSSIANAAAGSTRATALLQSPAYRRYESAALRWAANLLYIKSGATAPAEEVQSTYKQFFPQPGDPPDLQRQKAEARWQEMQSIADAYPGLQKPPQTWREPGEKRKPANPAQGTQFKHSSGATVTILEP